jgi:hypothetical protein
VLADPARSDDPPHPVAMELAHGDVHRSVLTPRGSHDVAPVCVTQR